MRARPCGACEEANGRVRVPGGVIVETSCWVVDHCYGPLGVGILIVKPKRQAAMFEEGEPPDAAAVEAFAERARLAFAS